MTTLASNWLFSDPDPFYFFATLWIFTLAVSCAWNFFLTSIYMAFRIFHASAKVTFWWDLYLQLLPCLLIPVLLNSLPLILNLSTWPLPPIHSQVLSLLLMVILVSLIWVLQGFPFLSLPHTSHIATSQMSKAYLVGLQAGHKALSWKTWTPKCCHI